MKMNKLINETILIITNKRKCTDNTELKCLYVRI